ncbi:MAG: hypothetical protein ACXW07_02495, partial [Nitrososphaeraceae archaeon]
FLISSFDFSSLAIQVIYKINSWIPVYRKKVQRIFRTRGYITPCRMKKDIIRSKISNVKADRLVPM